MKIQLTLSKVSKCFNYVFNYNCSYIIFIYKTINWIETIHTDFIKTYQKKKSIIITVNCKT